MTWLSRSDKRKGYVRFVVVIVNWRETKVDLWAVGEMCLCGAALSLRV